MRCRFLLFLFSASLFAQVPFTEFVVFGDSLSDNGNFYYGTNLLGVPQPGPPLYATGEYTDGTNSVPATTAPLGLWIEQLAVDMNLPVPQPYFSKAGTNFAVASALTGKNPSFSPTTPSVPYMTDQLNLFLAAHPSVPTNALYTFWGGANDILGGVSPATAVSNVQANITTLAAAGAKYFLWINQPPLGEVPENINTANRASLDAASVAYNTAWTAAIAQLKTANPGITIITYDSYSLFLAIAANPQLYGLTNVTSPAQGLSTVNPNTYLFWDDLHPTTAADAYTAAGAFNSIEAAFSGQSTSAAPQITSVINAFSNGPTIAPNTWVAIKGTGLSQPSDSRIWQTSDFTGGQLPTALDGVSVTMNGENAYVYYISPTQLNILTPPDLAVGPVQIQVMANGQTSVPFTVQAQTDSLAFFVFNGGPYVVATHLNYSIIGPTTLYPSASTPAAPGETVVLYANGFGVSSPPVVKGSEVQTGVLPLLPTIEIGGIPATVSSAGLTSPGLYQFNVVVPSTVPNGDNALTAQYNGQSVQSGVLLTIQSAPTAQSRTQ